MTLLLGLGCAHRSGDAGVETAQHVDYAAPVQALRLAGARCHDGQCRCRGPGDDAETQPPAPNHKRFEIRMSVAAGEIVVDSPTLGHFRHVGRDGAVEQCVYLDLPADSSHQFTIESREAKKGEGITPSVRIAEYGPQGPFWYDVITVRCGIDGRRCDRAAAEAWRDEWITHRRRGRMDACGSTVVSALRWDTSGGLDARDGGLLRDFRAQFTLQVKAFAPQLPPNSPQCVPQ